jgi:hypothetical protein
MGTAVQPGKNLVTGFFHQAGFASVDAAASMDDDYPLLD